MDNEQTRILIVNNSEDDREMYAENLFLKGYRVIIASDGKEGLEMAFELQPHLILLTVRSCLSPVTPRWDHGSATGGLRSLARLTSLMQKSLEFSKLARD
jgi:CheY-like chemotaxis protein